MVWGLASGRGVCVCYGWLDEWMSASLLRAQADMLSKDSLNTDAKKRQWLEVYMYKTLASLELPNACQSQICQFVEANDWNSTPLFLFFFKVGVDVYAVQLFSRCRNAQKWVWMFMLYSCSAGSQILRQVNITEGSGLAGTWTVFSFQLIKTSAEKAWL